MKLSLPLRLCGDITLANLILAFLMGCLVVGCGYHFRATQQPVGIKIDSLAIPMIASTSSDLGLEADFTQIVREEFISHARIPIVPEDKAHTVLTGRIYEIRTYPIAYRTQQQTVQGIESTFEVTSSRRLKIKMDIKLTDRRTGKVIWQERAMEDLATFAVSVDPLVTQFNQRVALDAIARRIAERIYSLTVERF